MAANIGVLLVPQSLARLHHRRDLTYRPIVEAPQSSVALAWPQDRTTELVEEFIGIVRGRTVNSSRGRGVQPSTPAAETKKGAQPRKPQSPKAGRPKTQGKPRPSAGTRGGAAPKRGGGKPKRRG